MGKNRGWGQAETHDLDDVLVDVAWGHAAIVHQQVPECVRHDDGLVEPELAPLGGGGRRVPCFWSGPGVIAGGQAHVQCLEPRRGAAEVRLS